MYFGVRVSSNLQLHSRFVSDSDPEIVLRNLEGDSQVALPAASNSGIILDLPREGRLEVTRESATLGARTTVDRSRAAELLGGPGFGLAAFLRGYAVLHGSSIIVDTKAVSLVGPSGAGKSTLAALGVRAGAGFCSDGMTLIDLQSGVCHSGPGRWKLCDDSVTVLGEDASKLDRVCSASLKRCLESPPPKDGQIASVLVIQEGDCLGIEWLNPTQAALQLMVHCYSVPALLPRHKAMVFERMTHLVRRVRVGRFFRPRTWRSAQYVGSWLLDNLGVTSDSPP